MATLFISLLTLALLLISFFVVLIVLMQKTSQSGGMGAALGGGAAESAFGADTTNVLTNATIYGIIAFFVVSLGLYLIYQNQVAAADESADEVLRMEEPVVPGVGVEGVEGVEGVAAEVQRALESGAQEGTNAVEEASQAVEAVAPSVEESAPVGVGEAQDGATTRSE